MDAEEIFADKRLTNNIKRTKYIFRFFELVMFLTQIDILSILLPSNLNHS